MCINQSKAMGVTPPSMSQLQKLLSSVYYSWATGSIYNAMSWVGEAAETFLPSS